MADFRCLNNVKCGGLYILTRLPASKVVDCCYRAQVKPRSNELPIPSIWISITICRFCTSLQLGSQL